MPREGLEPTLPFEKRILSPPRLPFRHLGKLIKAASGFEPLNRGFADPRLNHLATPPHNTGAEDGIRTRDLLLGKETFYR